MKREELREEFMAVSDLFTRGQMTLAVLAGTRLMRREYWVEFAGAEYPSGTRKERANIALARHETERVKEGNR